MLLDERAKAKMDPADVRKTTKIANFQILAKQVILRLKCFRIFANEMAINQLEYADDVLKVCAALPNLRRPIYNNNNCSAFVLDL